MVKKKKLVMGKYFYSSINELFVIEGVICERQLYVRCVKFVQCNNSKKSGMGCIEYNMCKIDYFEECFVFFCSIYLMSVYCVLFIDLVWVRGRVFIIFF